MDKTIIGPSVESGKGLKGLGICFFLHEICFPADKRWCLYSACRWAAANVSTASFKVLTGQFVYLRK